MKRNVTAEYYQWVDFVLMGQHDNRNLQCFGFTAGFLIARFQQDFVSFLCIPSR